LGPPDDLAHATAPCPRPCNLHALHPVFQGGIPDGYRPPSLEGMHRGGMGRKWRARWYGEGGKNRLPAAEFWTLDFRGP
jgi:hypothetical protein